MKPVLIVVAGPNGSGKTTVTKRLRDDAWSAGVEYLNPDEIALERFGDWNSPDAVLQAARWAEERREALLAAHRGIAFETVLSMPDKLDFIRRARGAGYFVRAFFIGTVDPAINAARILQRVADGGHAVPLDKIASRFARSVGHLRALIGTSDRTYVFDNSRDEENARLCARLVDGHLRKTYGELPTWVRDACEGVPRSPDFEHVPDP